VSQTKGEPKLKTLLLYWSATGNTEKVANTIRDTLLREGITPTVKKVADASAEELYDYDLIFLGAPSYSFQPPEPVQLFIKDKFRLYVKRGNIKPGAPVIPGKTAVVFCTYSGPHTGIKEATPAGDYMGQFFEHLGFQVAAIWYIVGEFHGREDMSTKGRLGDIRGRPNAKDLAEIEDNVLALVKSVRSRL
jgi:flavorubredoxin